MRIYVGNLAFRSNAEDVRKAFAVHGQVTSVELAIDRETGRSAGYAFVEMADDEGQAAIARLNGKEINSRVVVVTIASDAPVPEPSPRRPVNQERARNSERNVSRGDNSRRGSSSGPRSTSPGSKSSRSKSSRGKNPPSKSPWSNRPRGKPPG